MPAPPLSLADALAVLGLERPVFDGASLEEATRQLTDWQRGPLRRAIRRAARAAHPDRGGSTEAMARVNAAAELLRALRVVQRPPPPPRIVWSWSGLGAATMSAATSATTTVRW